MIRPLLLLALLLSALAAASQQPKPCGTAILARHRTLVPPHYRATAPSRHRAPALPLPRTFQGEKRGLVILVAFPDQPFSTIAPKQTWSDVICRKGFAEHGAPGSVSDYFYDQSYGQFSISFDVVGPVVAAHPYAYYGKNIYWGGADWFDQADGKLVEEACRAVADSVSFADYDWDGDRCVDIVFLIYAGYGESDYWRHDEDVIWQHEGLLSVDWADSYPDGITLQGMVIDTYACSNELAADGSLAGHGTICHEFSHCLGLMDHYDTVGGMSVTGQYDLMDSGNHNGDGWCPPGFSSFERYACGWLAPEPVADLQQVASLQPLHLQPDARIYREQPLDNAYYLIERRDDESWDRSLPSHGLMAWYVDYDEEAWSLNQVNGDYYHRRLNRVEMSRIPTGIAAATAAPRIEAVYHVGPVTIIRYSDGAVRKVLAP